MKYFTTLTLILKDAIILMLYLIDSINSTKFILIHRPHHILMYLQWLPYVTFFFIFCNPVMTYTA